VLWILVHTETQNNLNICRVQFRFPVVLLASWLTCWNELTQHAAHNPFAVVVMAQLQAQQTRQSGQQRLASKTRIVRLMYQYGYGREHVLRLFRLIDWMMALPPKLEPAFARRIYERYAAMNKRSAKPISTLIDSENPEWTKEMFDRTVGIDHLSSRLQKKLQHRGPRRSPTKTNPPSQPMT